MRKYLSSILYLLSLQGGALVLFMLFRLILFVQNFGLLQPESLESPALQSIAFVRGLWFDTVTSCYILILPLTFASLSAIAGYYGKNLYRALTLFMGVLNGIVLGISAANLPYFAYFFKNINSSILNWVEYGSTTLGMITQEHAYWGAFLCFLCGISLYVFFLVRAFRFYQFKMTDPTQMVLPSSFIRILEVSLTSALVIGLCLFGIRGRVGYNPIKVSAAYYCTDPFLNQLGLNPAFNLLITWMDDSRSENQRLHLMDDAKALQKAQQLLSVSLTDANHPFVRPVSTAPLSKRQNVVLIFMESMSARLMSTFGQSKPLTPFLDSLAQKSLCFTQIYSAGIHTNHGLYSTLYSFPTILKRNAMKGSNIPKYSGLPTILQDNGYHTMFFMTHESQYDNMNAFLRTNGYQDIYSQEDYPREKVVNSFGVPDDYLFSFALNQINQQVSLSSEPFFATLLTISNHPPYILPAGFKGRTQDPENQIVEYADQALSDFMHQAAREPWFKNTLFVLLGDHGKMVGNPESEMPDSYNHIPLLMYGADIQPKRVEALGGQIDVAPTLLGMLNITYPRQHLGVDLLQEKRPCIFYTADNLIGCRDNHNLYVYNPGEKQEFRYVVNGNGQLTPAKNTDASFNLLKEYAFSMLQTTEYLVKHGMTH